MRDSTPNIYEYHRTKTNVVEEEKEILFISAGITVERTQQLGQTTRKNIDVIVSKLTRYPISEAPPMLMALNEETITFKLSAKVTRQLVALFESDLEAFYAYQPDAFN